MSTFYMSGCSSNNDDAIKYFEERYFLVSDLIESDNLFQESLHQLISENPKHEALDEEQYNSIVNEIRDRLKTLESKCKQINENALVETENDQRLHKAYKALLIQYTKTAENEYRTMLSILEKEELTAADTQQFRNLYCQASQELNQALDVFYAATDDFAAAHDLEIELE